MSIVSSSRRKTRSGYILSFLLLLCSYCLLFYVQQRQVNEAGWVIHSYTVISKSEVLKAELTDAETGVRGYIITRDTGFLKPYYEALSRVPRTYEELKKLVTDNEEQTRTTDTLHRLITKRMDILTTGLAEIRQNNFVIPGKWLQQRQEGNLVMDSVRLYVARLNNHEQDLMNARKERLSGFFTGVKILAIISLIIASAAILFSVIIFNMENKAKEKAVKLAGQFQEDLESNINVIKEKDMELKGFKDMEKFTTTGRIARTIAHEVRNPLTNILLATEQLKETEGGNEETMILLELINRNASRINQLVSDLLNATRFTHLDFSTIEIKQILEETIEQAKDRIDLSRVSLEKNYAEENCEVYVDKEKIKVALLNIIVNAIEAMDNHNGGILELRTRKENNICIIEIRDNGKGMDEEQLQKLFDPYFTTKPKGNGLGLTNTQSIILNHNGRIDVSSKPAKGTLFVISLELGPET